MMAIERARPEDAGRLSEIAMLSKAYWGYPERWLEMWRPSLTISPQTIENHPVYVLSLGDASAGFYVLLGSPPLLDLDQLWVLPDWIGKGGGRALVEHALDQAKGMGAAQVGVQAEPHAEGFYLHMGARRVGEFTYELDGQQRVLPKLVFDINP